ncbi:Protein of unknown function [Gryllus bimaculatus]|nr:Protein of unknown function [Gryllus bimaculatus]
MVSSRNRRPVRRLRERSCGRASPFRSRGLEPIANACKSRQASSARSEGFHPSDKEAYLCVWLAVLTRARRPMRRPGSAHAMLRGRPLGDGGSAVGVAPRRDRGAALRGRELERGWETAAMTHRSRVGVRWEKRWGRHGVRWREGAPSPWSGQLRALELAGGGVRARSKPFMGHFWRFDCIIRSNKVLNFLCIATFASAFVCDVFE